MAAKEHKERKELLAERGCVRSTSRSRSDISNVVLIRTCCGWVCDHSRAPMDCGGRAQRRHRFSTGDRDSKAAWRFASRRSPNKFSCSYVALYSLRFLAILGALILSSIASYAEDLTTLDGKTFTNITEVAKYPKLVVFTYNSNRTSIAISNLPEEFRTKYKIIIKTNTPTVSVTQPQANPVDVFLAQNRNTDLMECDSDSEFATTNHEYRSWQLCLHGVEVSLTSSEDDKATKTLVTGSSMHFDLGQEGVVNQVFDKFIEWSSIAEKNHAEPFEKEIGRCRDMNQLSVDGIHTFSFHWDFGQASLWDSAANGIFYSDDVIHFREILKRLPAIKEKLADKIRNKEAQKNLFK